MPTFALIKSVMNSVCVDRNVRRLLSRDLAPHASRPPHGANDLHSAAVPAFRPARFADFCPIRNCVFWESVKIGTRIFDDLSEADFDAVKAMEMVCRDRVYWEQQSAEDWLPSWEKVPEHALTLTVSTLFHITKLIISVPGRRKAQVVRRTLEEPLSTDCPSTMLGTHPDATIYLDVDSASERHGLALPH
jgi:hypothetical protein